jgi:glucose-6-phosphate dehydrogenase assembly protein OpcA
LVFGVAFCVKFGGPKDFNQSSRQAKIKFQRPKSKDQIRFMQIQLEKTLDVEVVERELTQLWEAQTTAQKEAEAEDTAVLRARVANLMVFVPTESLLNDIDSFLQELTARHPSRVLVMMGDRHAKDFDIEMFVNAFCQTDKRTGIKRLCCEQITLKAGGSFRTELPSAALPLLVSDLASFLWWRNSLNVSDKVFTSLAVAADRLIIDSAESTDPKTELLAIGRIFGEDFASELGISDLNWARLTWWRSLLADFYDVPAYKQLLDQVDSITIEYVAPESADDAIAAQALLYAGWLASRLGWTFERSKQNQTVTSYDFNTSSNRPLKLELRRVDRSKGIPGKLVRVQLQTTAQPDVSFTVERTPNNSHVLTEARVAAKTQRGRVLPVRNRSAAQLLDREMEIVCNDDIYQDAVMMATKLLQSS